MPDLLAMLVLAALLAAIAKIAVASNEWLSVYLVMLAVMAPAAWYTWRDPKSPSSVSGWLFMAIGAIALGGLSFLVDASVGHVKNPDASAWEAAQLASSPFGFALTVTIFPGLFLISVAGAVRSAYLNAKRGA